MSWSQHCGCEIWTHTVQITMCTDTNKLFVASTLFVWRKRILMDVAWP